MAAIAFAWIEDLRLRRECACMSPYHVLAVHLVLRSAKAFVRSFLAGRELNMTRCALILALQLCLYLPVMVTYSHVSNPHLQDSATAQERLGYS